MNIRTLHARIPAIVLPPFALMGLLLATAVAYAGSNKATQQDVVETAIAAGQFDTLVTALKQADLVDTLKGKGPFTVFAPTDAAFAKIPADKLRALLADKEALVKVLTYHVVPGKVTAADVAMLETADTVEGQSISINTADGVKVNDAHVIQADIMASNGVIHVIDQVMMPR